MRVYDFYATGDSGTPQSSLRYRLSTFAFINAMSHPALSHSALHTLVFSTRPRRAFVEGVLASIDRRERLEQETLKRRQALLLLSSSSSNSFAMTGTVGIQVLCLKIELDVCSAVQPLPPFGVIRNGRNRQ